MNIIALLKSNSFIRRMGKKINIRNAFKKDASDFAKYYVEKAALNNDFRYSIMLLVHSLEKGMCMPKPRPYGLDKVCELMGYLEKMEANNQIIFEYKIGLSILNSWVDFWEKHNWTKESVYKDVKEFIGKREPVELVSGCREYEGSFDDLSEKYHEVISTRHSVRDFRACKLDMKDVQFAIDCFIETPTACNRQMCGLLYIENSEIKALLDKRVIGLPGFNKLNTHYFVITYDLSAFAYSGERHQGLFNAGLCSTNFINGLHAKGIGSCCLQWSNKPSEDSEVRKALGLRDSERIGIVIGCGYYKENNIIPCSVRKSNNEVFRVV